MHPAHNWTRPCLPLTSCDSLNSQHIRPEFLVTYVRDNIPREQGLEVMKQLLSNNIRVNLRIVVQMAQKHIEFFRAESLIELFDR